MPVLLERITSDERYLKNIQYGKPRRGHAEGNVAAHIAELEENLRILEDQGCVRTDQYGKLQVLIHVHDSFKAESAKDVPILHPQSHATLAREYLATLTSDPVLLAIVQYHDLGYALYRKFKASGRYDNARLEAGLKEIGDMDLYLLFCIIDACTASKGRDMIRWFVREVKLRYSSYVQEEWILPGPENFGEVF